MYIRECEIMGEQMKEQNLQENPVALLGRLIGGAVVDSVVNQQKEIDENVVSAVKTVAKSQVGKAFAKTAVGQIKSKVEQRLAREHAQQEKAKKKAEQAQKKQQSKSKKFDLEKKDETPEQLAQEKKEQDHVKRIETGVEIGKSIAKTAVNGVLKHLEK